MARRRQSQGTGSMKAMYIAFIMCNATGNTEDLMRETRAYVIKRLRSNMKVDAPENWLACPEMESSVDPPGDGRVSLTTSDGDADDFTQRVMTHILQKFPDFEGGPYEYRAWVKQICDNYNKRAWRQAKRDKKFAPLLVEVIDEDGETAEVDNPEIYSAPTLNNWALALPDWVQGVDRQIVNMLREGRPPSHISDCVGLSEVAIRQRFSRLLKKLEEEREAKKAARAERDAAERQRQEYKLRANRGYAAKIEARLALMRDDEYSTAGEIVEAAQPEAVGCQP